jgi:hypothetical protein
MQARGEVGEGDGQQPSSVGMVAEKLTADADRLLGNGHRPAGVAERQEIPGQMIQGADEPAAQPGALQAPKEIDRLASGGERRLLLAGDRLRRRQMAERGREQAGSLSAAGAPAKERDGFCV